MAAAKPISPAWQRVTYSIVLSKGGDRQGHGQRGKEAVYAVCQQRSLNPTPVDGSSSLDLGHLCCCCHLLTRSIHVLPEHLPASRTPQSMRQKKSQIKEVDLSDDKF